MKKEDIKIDADLESYLPALDKETKEMLEQSIIASKGATDPVVVWKGKNFLIDGHNRREICERLGLPYQIEERSFTDITEVKRFMLETQLSRRNLTEFMMKQMRGQFYNLLKQDKGENLKRKGQTKATKAAAPKGQSGPKKAPAQSTAKKVAEKFGTSERTVKRDAVFTKGVEAIKEVKGKEMADAVLTGTTKVRKQDVEAIGKAKTKAQREKLVAEALDPKTRAPKPKATPKAPAKTEAPAPAQNDELVQGVVKAARLVIAGTTPTTRRAALGTLAAELSKLDEKQYKVPAEFVGGKAEEPAKQDAKAEVKGVGAGAKSKPEPKKATESPEAEVPEMPAFLKRSKAS